MATSLVRLDESLMLYLSTSPLFSADDVLPTPNDLQEDIGEFRIERDAVFLTTSLKQTINMRMCRRGMTTVAICAEYRNCLLVSGRIVEQSSCKVVQRG